MKTVLLEQTNARPKKRSSFRAIDPAEALIWVINNFKLLQYQQNECLSTLLLINLLNKYDTVRVIPAWILGNNCLFDNIDCYNFIFKIQR